MPARCEIVDATHDDVEHVAANLRPEHVREIRGLMNISPADALRLSVATACRTFVCRAGDLPLCIAGASRRYPLSDVGSIFMLATPDIDRFRVPAAVALTRLFRRAHRLADTRIFEQYIPAWYEKGLEWAVWLGWKAEGTVMLRGQPHVRFVHEASVPLDQ